MGPGGNGSDLCNWKCLDLDTNVFTLSCVILTCVTLLRLNFLIFKMETIPTTLDFFCE